MTWIVGVDEAGYGPNLGPFVMSSVACRTPDDACAGDLWQLLSAAVCRAEEERGPRIIVDDSKAVYSPGRGLAELERGVLACLSELQAATLRDLVARLCPECAPPLHAEPWYVGDSMLPAAISA